MQILMAGVRVRENSNRFWTREPRTGVVLKVSRDEPTSFLWDDGSESIADNPLGVTVL